MEIVAIRRNHPEPSVIIRAAAVLRKGGAVVLPTDTAYGLAVNALDDQALACLGQLKGRPQSKPFPVAVFNFKQARAMAFWSKPALCLARRFWPGALTLVLPAKERLSRLLVGDKGTIGLRMPDSLVCRALAREAQLPYTITSANRSGGITPYTVGAVLAEFQTAKLKPDLILDGGTLPEIFPSTVVSFDAAGMQILRPGAIEAEALCACLQTKRKISSRKR